MYINETGCPFMRQPVFSCCKPDIADYIKAFGRKVVNAGM